MMNRYYHIPFQDMRRIRAQNLTSSIMQEITRLLPDDSQRDINEAIFNLLWRSGAEVITDHDRKDLGLPDRGNDGWSPDEMRALEARRLDMLLSPMVSKFSISGEVKP